MTDFLKNKSLIALLLFSLVCKLLLSYFVPVFADESYYYIWSLHPQLSYFDHPAMVSWFISFGHLLLPQGNPLALRISFVLASFIISLVWVKILKIKNFTPSAILFFITLYLLNPLLGVGAIVATPDTPLVLFWTLSYYCFLKILSENKVYWYALLGVFLGLGFCSKYHIVLFVISGLIYLVLSKKAKLIRPIGVLTTLGFGALFCMPVIVWNAQNEWSSFLFQIDHGFGESSFELTWALNYVVAQFFLLNPFIFLFLFKKTQQTLDKTFSLTQLGFFLTSSFRSIVEGNWPITSHLHATANFSASTDKKYFKYAVFYALFFYSLIIIFLLTPMSKAVKKNMANSSQLEELIPLIDKYKPLYGPSYQFASLLSWKSQTNIPKLTGLSRHDFYDSLPESKPTAQQFFVLKYDYSEWPAPYNLYKKIKIQSFDNTGLELYQFEHE